MMVEKIPWDVNKPSTSSKGLILSLAVRLSMVVSALAYYLCVVKRQKVHSDEDGSAITRTMIQSMAGGPREFDIREVRKVTNNFDERMKLGRAGYGVVYRVMVVDDHNNPGAAGTTVEVAVKKFSRASSHGQNDLAELNIINRLRHKHLVRLVVKPMLRPALPCG